jgi:hypothetical protein
MLSDRFVNSSSLFLVPHQETSSRFFVRPPPSGIPNYLTSNADSGHSDQQPSDDDIEDEGGGQDEGIPTLELHLDCSDVGSTVIITCDLRRVIDNVKTIALTSRIAHSLTPVVGAQVPSRQGPPGRLLLLGK